MWTFPHFLLYTPFSWPLRVLSLLRLYKLKESPPLTTSNITYCGYSQHHILPVFCNGIRPVLTDLLCSSVNSQCGNQMDHFKHMRSYLFLLFKMYKDPHFFFRIRHIFHQMTCNILYDWPPPLFIWTSFPTSSSLTSSAHPDFVVVPSTDQASFGPSPPSAPSVHRSCLPSEVACVHSI